MYELKTHLTLLIIFVSSFVFSFVSIEVCSLVGCYLITIIVNYFNDLSISSDSRMTLIVICIHYLYSVSF